MDLRDSNDFSLDDLYRESAARSDYFSQAEYASTRGKEEEDFDAFTASVRRNLAREDAGKGKFFWQFQKKMLTLRSFFQNRNKK